MKARLLVWGGAFGLPQMHISGIESGKIVPRFDTLRELVGTVASVRPVTRLLLLAALVRICRALSPGAPLEAGESGQHSLKRIFHFSLAGVQLKFSAVAHVVPATGVDSVSGSSPSPTFALGGVCH